MVSGSCPGLGSSWMQFAPIANGAALMKDAATTAAAYAKVKASEDDGRQHMNEQWCFKAIPTTDA